MGRRLFTLATAVLCMACTAASAQGSRWRPDQQKLSDPQSFSMILMGDPQCYTRNAYSQPIYDICTTWVLDNVDSLNIRALLLTGDMVQQNDNRGVTGSNIDQTSDQMWAWTSHCLGRLDGVIPYMFAGGNKDYGYGDSDSGYTRFPEFFPTGRNPRGVMHLAGAYPNREGLNSMENNAYLFEEPAWGRILIISVEFAPRDEVLDWARELASSQEHKDDMVILLVHSFLRPGGIRTDNEKYLISPRNWGQQVWDKLVQPSSNIQLVLCGHTGGPGSFDRGVAFRSDPNAAGRTVHQMMFNVQFLGGGRAGNGGDGWLRILEFLPDGHTIEVSTYSPLFGISPSTRHLAHRDEAWDRFSIVF